jgi:hypothetical protein
VYERGSFEQNTFKQKQQPQFEAKKNNCKIPTEAKLHFDFKEGSCGKQDDQDEELSFPSYVQKEVIAP